MSLIPLLLLSLSYVTPLALAHGYVSKVVINGKEYKGNPPGETDGFESPIRRITSFDPLYGADNMGLTCGRDARKAALVVDAEPGSTISFLWIANEDLHDSKPNWPHNVGPIITYMASCGKTSCKDFEASGAKWFKIAEAGKKKGSADWAQKDLMSRRPYIMTLPTNIAPGEYLIRNEVIGLHLAEKRRMAEFYPSCTQVRITGNGDGAPRSDETVTFPGTGYHDDDPGLFTKGRNVVYDPDSKSESYQFPGPKIAQFVLEAKNGKKLESDGAENAKTTPTAASTPPGSSSTPTEKTTSENSKGSEHSDCHEKRKRGLTPSSVKFHRFR
ncbi:glycosyl hydrolase family 61-domain-containing protein [Earliella scabrosa]|nr:glycosyl hydrolase family 61-domain-containing protein [Earliella scabrosa]